MKWHVENNIVVNYRNKCQLFADSPEAFSNFKRDKDYQKILEGNEAEVGWIALNCLMGNGKIDWLLENLDKFKENETIGNPQILKFDYLDVAASTLRYANSCSEILELLEGEKPMSILEIGGGYGGLCVMLSKLFDFETYTLVDLPEANALSNKYLSHFPVYPKTKSISCFDPIEGEFDLFIADSSLSECDMETQMRYAEAARKCKYIYIIYNVAHQKKTGENLEKILDLFIGMRVNIKIMPNVAIVRIKK